MDANESVEILRMRNTEVVVLLFCNSDVHFERKAGESQVTRLTAALFGMHRR